jgi:hypothetical protein
MIFSGFSRAKRYMNVHFEAKKIEKVVDLLFQPIRVILSGSPTHLLLVHQCRVPGRQVR